MNTHKTIRFAALDSLSTRQVPRLVVKPAVPWLLLGDKRGKQRPPTTGKRGRKTGLLPLREIASKFSFGHSQCLGQFWDNATYNRVPTVRMPLAGTCGNYLIFWWKLERVMGIEPTLEAWEAAVLPLNYTRSGCRRPARGRGSCAL